IHVRAAAQRLGEAFGRRSVHVAEELVAEHRPFRRIDAGQPIFKYPRQAYARHLSQLLLIALSGEGVHGLHPARDDEADGIDVDLLPLRRRCHGTYLSKSAPPLAGPCRQRKLRRHDEVTNCPKVKTARCAIRAPSTMPRRCCRAGGTWPTARSRPPSISR